MMPFNDPAVSRTYHGVDALLNNVGIYCFSKDSQGRYTFVNQAVAKYYKHAAADIIGQDDSAFFDLARSAMLPVNDRHVLETGEELHAEEELFLRGEDEPRVFWSIKVPIRSEDGRIVGLCGIATEITSRKRITDKIHEHNQLLDTLLSNIDAHIYMKARDGHYLFVNPKVSALYGRSEEDILGHTDLDLIDPESARSFMRFDRKVFESGTRQANEELFIDSQGKRHYFWSIKVPIKLPGQPDALIGFSSEITELLELRHDLEQKLSTDALTHMPNRLKFENALATALQARNEGDGSITVLLADIDQFKYINNSVGQELGDQVLLECARRLQAINDFPGFMARFTGDEFAFLITDPAQSENTGQIAERVRRVLSEPIHLGGQVFELTVSIGISVFPNDGNRVSELIGHAESAMYVAKEQGRNRVEYFSAAINDALSSRLLLERDLRTALKSNQFELHYQPKIDMNDGSVAGFEALLRWDRPHHGYTSPTIFIPLAEQLGLIGQLGDWVIEAACRQMAAWRTAGHDGIRVSVNLSPSQLSNPGLPDRVSAILQNYALGSDQLEMEITESMMMNDPETAIVRLHALHDTGIRLSVDDFGTGYSCMSYLKRLPIDTLKLDRSFIINIATDSRDVDICAGIIALAHKLGLDVIAEGVEETEQRDILVHLGCDKIQGYFYSRPLLPEQAFAYLQRPAVP